MSKVCNVILVCQIADEAVAEKFCEELAEIRGDPHDTLIEIGDHSGGTKPMEVLVYTGAFNYLDVPELVALFHRTRWPQPQESLLIYQDEHEHIPTMIRVYND